MNITIKLYRYVFDGKPPHMKSGEVSSGCISHMRALETISTYSVGPNTKQILKQAMLWKNFKCLEMGWNTVLSVIYFLN